MKFYQSSLLNKFTNIITSFTTKEDANLAFHVNDNKIKVIHNHKNLSQKHHYDLQSLIHMKQIHSNKVLEVQTEHNFDNPPTCDALITNKPNTPLMVMVADCSPIIFYDDKTKTIAVAHAGRAGAFHNIVKNVIDAFKNDFGANISEIVVSIGPAICQSCYEVGSEIFEEAQQLNLEYALLNDNGKYYLDIRKILITQLLKLGVQKENLEVSAECSSCNTKDYYSYRKEGSTGRFCGLIVLK